MRGLKIAGIRWGACKLAARQWTIVEWCSLWHGRTWSMPRGLYPVLNGTNCILLLPKQLHALPIGRLPAAAVLTRTFHGPRGTWCS